MMKKSEKYRRYLESYFKKKDFPFKKEIKLEREMELYLDACRMVEDTEKMIERTEVLLDDLRIRRFEIEQNIKSIDPENQLLNLPGKSLNKFFQFKTEDEEIEHELRRKTHYNKCVPLHLKILWKLHPESLKQQLEKMIEHGIIKKPFSTDYLLKGLQKPCLISSNPRKTALELFIHWETERFIENQPQRSKRIADSFRYRDKSGNEKDFLPKSLTDYLSEIRSEIDLSDFEVIL